MSNNRNTTQVIARDIVGNTYILDQFVVADDTACKIIQQVFAEGASFRDMRRAATRLGLDWEGTSNSNFKIKLKFSVTENPVYLPNGEIPMAIQEAFIKIFSGVKQNVCGVVDVDSRCLRVSLTIDRRTMWGARWDSARIQTAMGMFQMVVQRAVIGKKGWKIIDGML